MTVLILVLFMVITITAAMYEGVDPNTLSCDPLGQVTLHLPHFTDCSKFFMCAHGREVEFSCSGGLYFDFNIQTCNWPYNTKCHLRGQKVDLGNFGGNAFDWSSTSNSIQGSFSGRSMDAFIEKLRSMGKGHGTAGQTTYNTYLNMYLINMDFDVHI